MNTRLQVEHPVSEAITGLDFVELQLRVASGEKLPVRQKDLSINGWAFEARVYAEDVPKGFLPATGRLDHLRFPEGAEFEKGSVRVDSGVRQGDEISPWYDPMIAKVISHGPTREAALNMLTNALEACQVTGSVTNLEFLSALSRHDGFARGEVDTGLIARDLEKLVSSTPPSRNVVALAALGGLGLIRKGAGGDPWDRLQGWRHWTDARLFVSLDAGDRRIEAQVTQLGPGSFAVEVDGETIQLDAQPLSGNGVGIEFEDRQMKADLIQEPSRVSIFCDGRSHDFDLPDALFSGEADQAGGDTISAPMPGLVRAVLTKTGATVAQGDPLLVLKEQA